MDIDELLGIDNTSPSVQRARAIYRADRELIKQLVARRHRLGLTQDQVADSMDIDLRSVEMFETGFDDPRQSTIRRYALAVGATVTHAVAFSDD